MKLLILAALLAAPAAALAEPDTMPPAFAQLAAKVAPSVVSVASTDPVTDNSGGDQNDQNNNDQDNNDNGPDQDKATGGLPGTRAADPAADSVIPPPKAEEALGSGFVIDPAGFIVTNNHVIDGAASVTVTFQDGTILPATVVGTDKDGDLAVLKVDAGHPLPALAFGDSSKLRVGDWVMAIGNPYGLSGSTSAGIISALHRDIGEDKFDDFIQTDATINRGNSGGPLFNLAGQVIGVNSAIYSPSGGSVGIGFAIPAAMVQPVAASIEQYGDMTRGWLGVSAEDVTPEMQTLLNLPGTQGALIGGVAADGPAFNVLRPGDVIVALNGAAITNPRSLMIRTAEIPSGQAAIAKFYRDGVLQTASFTVAVPPPEEKPGSVPAAAPDNLALNNLGLTITADAPAQIVSVAQNSPAAKAGIAVDDTIQALDTETISTGQDLKTTLATWKSSVASLLISGDDATGTDPGPRWVALPVGLSK
jgi:serine protease Do/2-alkenal reductase